jgi:hypothetical protein
VAGPQNTNYRIHPDGTRECRFPVQILSGSLLLKLEGFRLQWNAEVTPAEPGRYLFHLEVASNSFWERRFTRPRKLEIEVIVPTVPGVASQMTEARVYIRLSGVLQRDLREEFLDRMGPQFFDSLRSFLQAQKEQRSDERRPFHQLMHVYPIRQDLELAEVLLGVGIDICSGGFGFRVPALPETEWFYLHFPDVPAVAPFALLARLLRASPVKEGGYDVAACLLGT